jgi:hypothetical protein
LLCQLKISNIAWQAIRHFDNLHSETKRPLTNGLPL